MVQDFCAAMGWDAEWQPRPEKRRELGLERQTASEFDNQPRV